MKNLVLFSILVFLGSCASWQSPEIEKFNGIKKVKVKSRSLTFTLSADVMNPNKKRLTLYESHIDLIIENKKIGTASNLEPFTLKKNTTTSVSCPFKIETEKGALFRLAAFTLKDSVRIELKGDLTVKSGIFKKTIPIKESRKISTRILQLLDKENVIKEYR